MPDYIPPADDDFDHWFTTFTAYVTGDASAPAVPAADKTALNGAHDTWQTAYAAYRDAQRAAEVALTAKDTARDDAADLIRRLAGDLQRDEAVTDPQRTAAGLPIYKEGRSPAPEPTSFPVLRKVDTSTRLVLRLFFADSQTPDRSAKPEGARFCEVRAKVGGDRPVDPDALEPLAMETRAPYRADFEPGEEGKTAWLAFRWIGSRGDAGPWSPIYSAVIPG